MWQGDGSNRLRAIGLGRKGRFLSGKAKVMGHVAIGVQEQGFDRCAGGYDDRGITEAVNAVGHHIVVRSNPSHHADRVLVKRQRLFIW